MNQGPLVFLASFFAFAISWLGFVLGPQLQIGGQQRVAIEATGEMYPVMRPGLARQGEQVYRANGCYYCHSQQVRPKGMGADAERMWGGRASVVESVNQDYLYDHPAMPGNQRVGPDLANIGLRQTNFTLLLLHLYEPQLTVPKSVMPPYRYLFVKRKLAFGESPSADALPLPVGTKIEAGYEVVPTEDARSLVAYLVSLHSDSVLFEAPPIVTRTNAPASATKTTNSPAK